jgi:hypothetical protein
MTRKLDTVCDLLYNINTPRALVKFNFDSMVEQLVFECSNDAQFWFAIQKLKYLRSKTKDKVYIDYIDRLREKLYVTSKASLNEMLSAIEQDKFDRILDLPIQEVNEILSKMLYKYICVTTNFNHQYLDLYKSKFKDLAAAAEAKKNNSNYTNTILYFLMEYLNPKYNPDFGEVLNALVGFYINSITKLIYYWITEFVLIEELEPKAILTILNIFKKHNYLFQHDKEKIKAFFNILKEEEILVKTEIVSCFTDYDSFLMFMNLEAYKEKTNV